MSLDALLRTLEPLTHDGRMRRMVELGKDASAAATLDDLGKGGFYQRLLALQACYGSGDARRAVGMLADPSRILQGRALQIVSRFAPDAEVTAALIAGNYERRLALLCLLRRFGRLQPIDAFLDDCADREPTALTRLLPFGSRSVVDRRLAGARQLAGDVFWRRLARLHPGIAVATIEADLAGSEEPGPRLAYEASIVLGGVALRHPELGLRLARALAAHLPVTRLLGELQRLARRRPAGVADLLLESPDNALVSLDTVARRLDVQQIRSLLERRPGVLARSDLWFRRLAPPARADLFVSLERHWRNPEGCTSAHLIAQLPVPLRREEAQRNLNLPALATRPAQRMPYAAFLPWVEAVAVLDPWIKHPEGELRAQALRTLAWSVRYERHRLADLLVLLRARKHEQDPVRSGMLLGLAELPPGVWRTDHLEGLGQVLRDALSAADLSGTTASYAERLVVALLRFHPDWAAGWLATLARERGHLHVGDLQNRLNDADVRRIAVPMLPVLRSWQNRERQGQLLSFAQSLGRRIPAFPGLLDILEKEVQVSRTQWIAESILSLLAEHGKARFPALVVRLLRDDPSWATRAVVYQYLHRRRQDLLTPFLGQQAYSGRFSTGRTRFVLPFDRGFFRWTPVQQTTFQKTLQEVMRASTDPHDTSTILVAIRQLAGLPAVDVETLAQLAADERPAIQEGALRVLGRLDAGQGVPILLEAMGDQRARVAIYVLRSALLAMPTTRAVAVLRAIKRDKVTVAKECVRLLGEIPSDEAFEELRRLDGETLHRDVRIALLRPGSPTTACVASPLPPWWCKRPCPRDGAKPALAGCATIGRMDHPWLPPWRNSLCRSRRKRRKGPGTNFMGCTWH